MKFTIIIPAYNEESTIKEILNRVSDQKNNHNLEIIVIDDASTDNTRNIVEQNIHLVDKFLKLTKNQGKGAAVIEGLKSAEGDYVLFQDADLEYNPKDYNKIFSVINELNADIVIGSRFLAPKYVRVHYFWHAVEINLLLFFLIF